MDKGCNQLITDCKRKSHAHCNRSSNRLVTHRLNGFNRARPEQNGGNFAEDIFGRIWWKDSVRILLKSSLRFVLNGPVGIKSALVQVMARHRAGEQPLSKLIVIQTHNVIWCY